MISNVGGVAIGSINVPNETSDLRPGTCCSSTRAWSRVVSFIGDGFCGNCAPPTLACMMNVVNSAAKNRCTFLRLANFLGLFAALGSAAWGQLEIKPADPVYPRISRRFEKAIAEHRQRPLSCRVDPGVPRLAYSFRFFSGYYATFPARQLERGDRNRAAVFFRVTSKETGEAHLFIHRLKVPPIPEFPGSIRLETGGGFYLGAGTYKVEWILADQKDRVCFQSWKVKTPRTKLALLVPAGSIQPLGLETWKGFQEKKPAAALPSGGKLTVFLSAMPVYRRRSLGKLQPYDLAILLSSLTTLLDSSKYAHARVVAFDLLSKRILFEQDEFDPAGYQQLRDTLENTNYGAIDYKTLSSGVTDSRLLERMLKEETARADKSDAVVFLGAEGYMSDRLPPVFNEYRQSLARLYYVPFVRFAQPVEDVMYQFVHAGKGKIVTLFGPHDLVNAIRAIDAAAAN